MKGHMINSQLTATVLIGGDNLARLLSLMSVSFSSHCTVIQ